MSVVALANYRVGKGIQNPRSLAPASFVKISRILFQQRWQNSGANERTRNRIGVACAVSFRITFCTLPVSAEVILRLLDAGNPTHQYEGYWINHRFPRDLKFLPGAEGTRIGAVTDITFWDDAQHTLLLFQ